MVKTSAILFVIFMMIAMRGVAMENIMNAIPREILGWQAVEPDEFYDRETLYDLIDGGAELYLTYDFRQAMVRRFTKPDAPEIELGVYDMGSAADAYGIFSVERQDQDIGVGHDSEYGGGLLRFWKGHYFVTVLAIGDEAHALPAIVALAHGVANAIPQISERPSMLSFLPQQNLIQTRLRFFHSHQVLNRQYFLASENILKLDRLTDAVFATYQINSSKCFLLMIQYPDSSSAKDAYAGFVDSYLPDANAIGATQTENGNWTIAKLLDRYLIIVFEAPDKNWAVSILDQTTRLLGGK